MSLKLTEAFFKLVAEACQNSAHSCPKFLEFNSLVTVSKRYKYSKGSRVFAILT